MGLTASQPEENTEQQGLPVGIPVRYFLLGDDEQAQRKLVQAKQRCIADTVARLSGSLGDDLLQSLQKVTPVLVTGSCGYLGEALLSLLRAVGLQAQGLDLMAKEPGSIAGDVSDEEAVQRSAVGCRSIIHTAALHAPNLDFYTEADFRRINLEGTRHVLNTASKMGMVGVVFSSTTSLMNTLKVKEQTRSAMMVLEATEDYGTPRNIYGVTKKLAEENCKESSCSVAILRLSRFFAEDAYDTSVDPSQRSSGLTNGNVKANELLCGTRASLEDMIMAHLLSLVKIGCESSHTLGPLIVSAPSPLLEKNGCSRCSEAKLLCSNEAKRMYEALGWTFPHLGRVLDSRHTWQSLNWQPRWSFQQLVQDFESGTNLDLIRDGSY